MHKTLAMLLALLIALSFCCGCGDDDPSRPVALPFVNGAFYVSDKVDVDGKSVSVKRGGAIFIDK